MFVKDLVPLIPELQSLPGDAVITNICRNSDLVKEGSVFVAIAGTSWDGHDFIEQALRLGASLILAEKKMSSDPRVFIVSNTRKIFAELQSLWFGEPSKNLFMVGLTGTNGKTTSSFMVEHLLNKISFSCGVIGTIDHHLKEKVWPTSLTSPGADLLQERLEDFTRAGAKACVMEVSSHALDQYRVDGTAFDAAIFTNLTQDHLDYHQDMESYFKAKARLFTDLLLRSSKPKRLAIINTDDAYGSRLCKDCHKNYHKDGHKELPGVVSFGQKNADVKFSVKQLNLSGTVVEILSDGKSFTMPLRTIGLHNVYNLIGVACLGKMKGVSLEEALKLFDDLPQVPGRLEKIFDPNGRHIFVDYAHTPDALERSLTFLRSLQRDASDRQKLFVVFGAGGNRDTRKRPMMGAVASRLADEVFITSDNPRYEEPNKIIEQIAAGITSSNYTKIENRHEAIKLCLKKARPNDIILIAGKGHEEYQEIEGTRYPFSDRKLVQELIND